MSYVYDLLAAYRDFVTLPWQQNVAGPQRVWMAVYPAEHERWIRLYLPEFEIATKQAQHSWALIDITTHFEHWMADHEYREEYFESPDLLGPALPDFFKQLVARVRGDLAAHGDPEGVVGLLGAGTLFGLGDAVKVSALLNATNDAVAGRLLVFFPGEHQDNSYRLLDARDGWNYTAVPITPKERTR